MVADRWWCWLREKRKRGQGSIDTTLRRRDSALEGGADLVESPKHSRYAGNLGCNNQRALPMQCSF